MVEDLDKFCEEIIKIMITKHKMIEDLDKFCKELIEITGTKYEKSVKKAQNRLTEEDLIHNTINCRCANMSEIREFTTNLHKELSETKEDEGEEVPQRTCGNCKHSIKKYLGKELNSYTHNSGGDVKEQKRLIICDINKKHSWHLTYRSDIGFFGYDSVGCPDWEG